MSNGTKRARRALVCAALLTIGPFIVGSILAARGRADDEDRPHGGLVFPNPGGSAETYDTNGEIDTGNPFFQSLGTNGRACVTCHTPSDGWSVTPPNIQKRFDQTGGADPIFRPVDGSNCDNLDVSTIDARRSAYSLLLSRGLIRIQLPVPAGAEFTVAGVSNYYGDCNSTTTLSVYRRPLPAANLRFLSAVMWDGRESTPPDTQAIAFATNPADLLADLAHQALDATSGHAQGTTPLTSEQQGQIADFEMSIFAAQRSSKDAGRLDSKGAAGGAKPLAAQQFFVGINDSLGKNPLGTQFTPTIFNTFDAWSNLPPHDPKSSIARGQAIFNSKPINITGVGGLNDVLGLAVIPGTCGTCHDSPNAGNHSFPAPLDIGIAGVGSSLGTAYLPVYTLRNTSTGATVQTTDPGRAMTTGKWADIGKVKGPVLRNLSARAPYFHNGSAATLMDAIDFYETRFAIPFTDDEKTDLVNFLSSL